MIANGAYANGMAMTVDTNPLGPATIVNGKYGSLNYRITSVKAPWDSIWNAQTHLLSHLPISDNIPVGLYPKWGGGS